MLVKHIQPRDSRENQTLDAVWVLKRAGGKKRSKIFGVCSEKCEMPASSEMRDATSKMVLDGSHSHIALRREVGVFHSVSLFAKSRLSLSDHPSALFANVKATLPMWDSPKT